MRQATPAGGAPLCDLFLPLVAWREDVKWAVFAAHNYDRASGSWHRQEVPCPDFGEWWNTAVGLQGGYPPLGRFAEPLEVYGERIRTLSETEWPEGFVPRTGGGEVPTNALLRGLRLRVAFYGGKDCVSMFLYGDWRPVRLD